MTTILEMCKGKVRTKLKNISFGFRYGTPNVGTYTEKENYVLELLKQRNSDTFSGRNKDIEERVMENVWEMDLCLCSTMELMTEHLIWSSNDPETKTFIIYSTSSASK